MAGRTRSEHGLGFSVASEKKQKARTDENRLIEEAAAAPAEDAKDTFESSVKAVHGQGGQSQGILRRTTIVI